MNYVDAALALLSLAMLGYSLRTVARYGHKLGEVDERVAGLREYVEELDAALEELERRPAQAIQTRGPAAQPVKPKKAAEAPDVPDDGLPLQGHTLIVGQSGSGKSNLLMSQIMRKLAAGHEVHVIDTKDEIAQTFGGVCDVYAPECAEEVMDYLLSVASKRRGMFNEAAKEHRRPIRDFGEYTKVTGLKLPVISLVIEELIVFRQKVDEDRLIRMLVECRSAGVFVTALSQYLKANILSREGSINFSTRVFLGPYDRIAAGILFTGDSKQLADFVGPPGKGIVEERGEMSTRTFPEVTVEQLARYYE